MAFDSDYSPVGVYEDEEDRRRDAGYAPAVAAASSIPAATPGGAGYAPVYPATPGMGTTQDLEARAARPKTAMQDLTPKAPAAPAPKWSDYAPPEPHGWAKFGHIMAGLSAPTNYAFNIAPEKRAQEKYKNAVSEYERPISNEAIGAQTEEHQARAGLERGQEEALTHPKPTEEEFKVVPGVLGPGGKVLQEGSKGTLRWAEGIAGAEPLKPPQTTSERHKMDMEAIGSRAGVTGNPKTEQQEITNAVNARKITPQEAADYRSFRNVEGTQGTKVEVPIEVHAGEEATDLDKQFTGKEVIVHGADGSRKQMTYGDAKKAGVPMDQMTILNAKEAQDNRDKSSSIDATMGSLRTYRNDFKTLAPKLQPKDRDAMRILTDHAQGGQMAGILGSFFDDIPLAGPLNEYANKLLRGTMTSDQYNNLSPEGKKLVADYFNQLVSNFANMKAILGSMGRNPAQIQAEINRVPLPYLDWNSASNLFDSTRNDIRTRAGSLPQLH